MTKAENNYEVLLHNLKGNRGTKYRGLITSSHRGLLGEWAQTNRPYSLNTKRREERRDENKIGIERGLELRLSANSIADRLQSSFVDCIL